MSCSLVLALGLASGGCSPEVETRTEPAIRPPHQRPAVQQKSLTGKVDLAPVIESVQLVPQNPRSGEPVRAVVVAWDPEERSLALAYEWRVDGREVDETGPVLMVPPLPRGTRIEVEVVARDGLSESDLFTAESSVGNRPPKTLGVDIHPRGLIKTGSSVTARPRGTDPDGDEISWEYAWSVAGEVVSEAATLTPDLFDRGDRISLTVIANDDEDYGEPFTLSGLGVTNAAPVIVSSPTWTDRGGRYVYQVKASDPDDGRRLRYALIHGPAGMSMDSVYGEVVWEPPEDQNGEFAVEIEVRDPNGASTRQRFTVNVGYDAAVPAAPAPR